MQATEQRAHRNQERKIPEGLDLTAMIKTTILGSIHIMAANAIQNMRRKWRLTALQKRKQL